MKRIGVIMGDAAGVGPEVVAKALASVLPDLDTDVLLIGDSRVYNEALSITGADIHQALPLHFLDTKNLDPSEYQKGIASLKATKASIDDLLLGLSLLKESSCHAMVFGPLDKKNIRLLGYHYRDEHELFADYLGFPGQGDAINVLDHVWSARVTSHIPLSEVPGALSKERVLLFIRRLNNYLRATGIMQPRIGVSALNPHCGEGGLCGTEEINVIQPAVAQARAEGINAVGPVPADIICIKTFLQKEFDGIVSMFHDQVQSGIKLISNRSSITVTGGIPYSVCTTSHGTGYDIAGKGIADARSFENALRVASRMSKWQDSAL
ncbi:MAG: 4-hydroxythreonine-4-phosphate dehydrogenase PdxA [Mailhella sp.]|nr:4-hydroxythreonine-4-phosphate dehydrogenase PdxA [Mailhella sp.]